MHTSDVEGPPTRFTALPRCDAGQNPAMCSRPEEEVSKDSANAV